MINNKRGYFTKFHRFIFYFMQKVHPLHIWQNLPHFTLSPAQMVFTVFSYTPLMYNPSTSTFLAKISNIKPFSLLNNTINYTSSIIRHFIHNFCIQNPPIPRIARISHQNFIHFCYLYTQNST